MLGRSRTGAFGSLYERTLLCDSVVGFPCSRHLLKGSIATRHLESGTLITMTVPELVACNIRFGQRVVLLMCCVHIR